MSHRVGTRRRGCGSCYEVRVESKKNPWTVQPSYEGLLDLVDTLNAGLFVYPTSGQIEFANERSLEWTGYSAEELDGQPASVLVPKESIPPIVIDGTIALLALSSQL